MESTGKRYYDADYIIRKNHEYEDERIFNSPVERKLRRMIVEATEKCKIQEEKLRAQREKLRASRLKRELEETGESMGM